MSNSDSTLPPDQPSNDAAGASVADTTPDLATLTHSEKLLYWAARHRVIAEMEYAELVEAFDSTNSYPWSAHLLKVDQTGAAVLRAHELVQLYERIITASGGDIWSLYERFHADASPSAGP